MMDCLIDGLIDVANAYLYYTNVSLCFYETCVRGQDLMPGATRHASPLRPNARIFFLVPNGAKKLVLAARPAFVLPRILQRSQI